MKEIPGLSLVEEWGFSAFSALPRPVEREELFVFVRREVPRFRHDAAALLLQAALRHRDEASAALSESTRFIPSAVQCGASPGCIPRIIQSRCHHMRYMAPGGGPCCRSSG